ncbi:hypothetical protein [Novosphingobium sp. KA1]|uniref:gp53-like domain-containing protein n=1 Tax=Novosphingobium sp. (strain KA1) TaxID=164608 RepID=UPI001A8C6AD8|nr:hypothetical protein [Novosphingobium sp. KA1]QSR17478.1 hypothetical protein CA833_09830 [Novosphingobium sp. KA1]
MAALSLKLTDAGLAAVQGASGSDPVSITHLGLTATAFDYAPTLVALPGEFKRLEVASGTASAPNITHLTAYDTSGDNWSITGFGLFMGDGQLFAVHTSAAVIMTKAELAFGLMAFDIAFDSDLAANIDYGNAVFAYPPATQQARGVARLATQERVDAEEDGEDDAETIVTPKTLRQRLQALSTAVSASIDALNTALNNGLNSLSTALDAGLETLRQRRIVGGGLVTGGGDLYADRTLTVTEADAEDITAGTSGTKVVTPRRLGPISMSLAQNGFIRFFGFQIVWGRFTAAANSTTPVWFIEPFPSACFAAVVSGVTNLGADSKDNTPAVIASSITKDGFNVFSADDEGDVTCFIAVGF